MQVHKHAITTDDSNASFQLTSFHFGTPGQGKKVYIQAALHADEVPGMLVSQFLKEELGKLEQAGKVSGEIILVPAANPIGLSQAIHGAPFGRFDLSTGVNFNRAYKHVAEDLKTSLEGKLGSDPASNVTLVRAHARDSVQQWEPKTNTDALKKTLLQLAIDADYVLDLHCDNEAVIHIYTGTPLLDKIKPLAAILGAHAVLVSLEAGGEPFDEACSSLWWDLAHHFGPAYPIPPSCVSTTIELRGEMDVSYEHARKDAAGILQYLAHQGVLNIEVGPLPAPLCQATPLEGVEPITAPHAGVLVFLKKLGDRIEAGETVADLIDPVSGRTSHLQAQTSGVFFASTAHRHLLRGMAVGKIASPVAYRSGSLLSA
jgi:predicted deacylase